MLRAWLARSGILPLSIDVRFFCDADVETMMALIPYAQRWRHVELATIRLQPIVEALRSLDALESIKLGPLGDTNELAGLSSILSVAPKLRSVEWRVSVDITILRLPWSQLTHLDYHTAIATHSAINLLEACPLLVDVHFHRLILSRLQQEASVVTLHHLRTLRISRSFDYTRAIFRRVVLPNLRELVLGNPSRRLNFAIRPSSFVRFVTHMSSSLERITLVGCTELTEASLIEVLGILPGITHLDVQLSGGYGYVISDAFMTVLALRCVSRGIVNHYLLPHLENLRLRGKLTFSENSFLEMVKARSIIGAPEHSVILTTIDIDFEEAVSKKAAASLMAYRDSGISFPQWLDMVEGPILQFPEWLYN
ncbi:hypothetical protein HWV62_3755 [Athelia sp. TMB]|nr:hypothetical protein HWV62_3755 [Athelia sp. TMB]